MGRTDEVMRRFSYMVVSKQRGRLVLSPHKYGVTTQDGS